MSKETILLEKLYSELKTVGSEITGSITKEDEQIQLGKNLSFKVELIEDPDNHESITHAHIKAVLPGEEDVLDACIVGIGDTPEEGLDNVVENWRSSVAGPVLSLINGATVLEAAHFTGTEPWSVKGCHGFIGPLAAKAIKEAYTDEQLSNLNLFEHVAELAPPGITHICKVILKSIEGRWFRHIEIDGHKAVYVDTPDLEIPVPEFGLFTCYCVFHIADRPEISNRKKVVDESLELFFSFIKKHNGDMDRAADELEDVGVDEDTVQRILSVLPVAFGRVRFAGVPVKFSPNYIFLTKDSHEELPLMGCDVFPRALIFAYKVMQTDSDLFEQVSYESSECNVMGRAMKSGLDLNDYALDPVFISDAYMTKAEIQQSVMKILRGRKASGDSGNLA